MTETTDIKDYRLVQVLKDNHKTNQLEAMVLCPYVTTIVAVVAYNQVNFFDVVHGGQYMDLCLTYVNGELPKNDSSKVPVSSEEHLKCGAWSQKENGDLQFCVGCTDQTIHVLDFVSGKVTAKLEGHGSVPTCMTALRDGKTVASLSAANGTIIVWDMHNLNEVCRLTVDGASFLSLPLKDSTEVLLSAGASVWSLDLSCGSVVPSKRVEMPYKKASLASAHYLSDTTILCVSTHKSISVWDLQSGKKVYSHRWDYLSPGFGTVQISSCGKYIAAGCTEGRVMLINPSDGGLLKEFSHSRLRKVDVAWVQFMPGEERPASVVAAAEAYIMKFAPRYDRRFLHEQYMFERGPTEAEKKMKIEIDV